ncbi:MAG: threonine dehydratase [Steroidobacteraceae bacterium]|jgi:threonine dehydratase|nr:threonine dehydratase [Steroidobacteraceae bacterium]
MKAANSTLTATPAPQHFPLPGRDAIEEAAELLRTLVPPTPQYLWPQVVQAFGANVWIKHENHTPIGAFKARSAAIYFHRLMQKEPASRGVITATRGNHGQAVGLAARRFKLPATVYVPRGNSVEKNDAMRALGVKLVEHGIEFQEAREEAASVGAREALHMVPAFHQDIVLGVATYWAELFRAVPDIDVVYAPIGQGSGICAAAAARNVYSPRTKIVGVCSAQAPCFARSFEAGQVVEAPVSTVLGDGMACRKPDAEAVAIVLANVERIVEVTDAELADAMRRIFAMTHNVAEGAGAAAFAAAWRERESLQGRRVGLTLSGGNVDSAMFADVLAGKY